MRISRTNAPGRFGGYLCSGSGFGRGSVEFNSRLMEFLKGIKGRENPFLTKEAV